MKKKILIVSDTKNWGGWVRGEYIKKYLSDKFDFELYDANEFNEYERSIAKDVFSINDIDEYVKIKGNDKEFIYIEEFRKWINSQKIDQKFDLIYFLFHTMLVKKSVKRMLNRNVKIITMVTVYPTLRPIFYNENERGTKLKFLNQANKCSAILANNEKSLNDLKEIYKGKTYLATRGVDVDIFYPLKEEFIKKEPNKFTVAFCGKPNPEKGLKNIIKPACKKAGVKLITNERNFENALDENEMREFYNKADCYIVASTMDGTPNTALEAAACGKPILSNNIGNMPEFIIDGKNGFLINLEIKEYINKLKWMKNSQKKVWDMGQNARQTILDGWTWEKVLNKNERIIFNEVLNEM